MQKQMTYGDGQALMVLAAERMGLSPAMVEDAKKLLAGEAVHPIFGAAISQEACRMNNQLRHDATLIEAANGHVKALMAEYGFSPQADPVSEKG